MTPLSIEESATAVVRRLKALAPFPDNDEQALLSLLNERVRHVDAHKDLVSEGDKPEVMRVILSGWAHRYKVLEDGRRQIINFVLPGDACDLNIFLLSQMDHSLGALTPVTFSELSPDAIAHLSHKHPAISRALWCDALVGAAIQREWTVNLGQRSAYERLAHLLCEIFVRLDSVGLTEDNACSFPVTQADLADATGLSAVHVNRILQELRAAGLIVLRGKGLTITDFDGLKLAGLFNPNYLHLPVQGDAK